MIQKGLQPLPKDNRDFKLGALFDLPPIEELPEEFSLGCLWVENQIEAREDDFCSAYATCGASELQEEVKLSRRYSFALSKELSGDKDEWGQDLRTAMKVHTKFGAVEEKDLDDKETLMDSVFARDITNYREILKSKALVHKKKTYIYAGDTLDDIKRAIWKFRDEKRAIVLGVEWGWSLREYFIDKPTSGYGHALYAIGWNKLGLEVVNSAGLSSGNNGRHILSKVVVNKYLPRFGAFMFIDMPREYVEWLKENNAKADQNWISQFISLIKELWKKLFS